MKKLLLTLLIFSSTTVSSQTVNLPKEWKFITGDNIQYKEENFDDVAWEKIKVPSYWEDNGHADYNGFAWYRVQFTVPQNMIGKELMLMIAAIDDADETYLNGSLIGATGKFPPTEQSAWDAQRKYKLTLTKATNTLAIRVYDGNIFGGLYKAPLEIITKTEYDRRIIAHQQSKKSYTQLTTSNGLIVATYNTKTNLIEAAYPHIFSYYDSAKWVEPFVNNIKFIVKDKPIGASYLQNTHVIEVQYPKFVIDYFAPFTTEEKILYAVIKGNANDIKDISFTSEKAKGKLLSNSFLKKGTVSAEKYFLFSFTDSLHRDESIVDKALAKIMNGKNSIATDEVNFMRKIIASAKLPKPLTTDEKNLCEQSVSILKMSQVSNKEIFPLSHGQILASLRPGVWSISWVRDASFAIRAMAQIGMFTEAKKGLEFMLNAAPTNQYKTFIFKDGKDYGIKHDYRISVTRYFGNGREEADFDERGPNIELDDFGLFLMAFSDYVKESGDKVFFDKWHSILENETIVAIIQNIDSNDLIRTESGPWEHHLPGHQYTFTNGVNVMGLNKFAALCDAYNIPSAKIKAAAKRLQDGIMKNMLFENRLLKGNAQEKKETDHFFYDCGVFELFSDGFSDNKKLFHSTLEAYDKQIHLKSADGYMRFNSDDSYENQEWPTSSLWVAMSHIRFGNNARAKKLIDRITIMSANNNNVMPEIYTREEWLYNGATPMVGYGAGMYLLALKRFYKN
jgi:GH15 family glucan-1,4-alpha-glucosidase